MLCVSVFKIALIRLEDKSAISAYEEIQPEPDINSDSECPISVNFDLLCLTNRNIIAWLYCEGTPINYPVMRSVDNKDYLSRLPNGDYSRYGTPFLDCRCSTDFTDFKSVIYGHNMKNSTMFGTLTEYREQSYYDKHSVMYLLTPDKAYRVELFAGFDVTTDDSIYSISESPEQGSDLINIALSKSDFTTAVTPDENEKVLVLSTCSYKNEKSRYVLIGSLTER